MTAIAGGCTCGAVRYALLAPPMFVQACHCTWCQRETGSAFVVNGQVEAWNIRLTGGTPKVVITPSASGRGQRIARCPVCHVALWSTYSDPRKRFVRMGTLDDTSRFPPQAMIFTDTKQPWLTLPADIPAFAEYYEPETLWPADSLVRQRVLLDAPMETDLP